LITIAIFELKKLPQVPNFEYPIAECSGQCHQKIGVTRARRAKYSGVRTSCEGDNSPLSVNNKLPDAFLTLVKWTLKNLEYVGLKWILGQPKMPKEMLTLQYGCSNVIARKKEPPANTCR
jgi:hypothetical protein